MKKVLFGLSLLAIASFSMVSCGDDKVIEETELPKQSQDFITTYFSGHSVSRIEKEGRNYSVIFGERGSQIEVDFNADGEWVEVDGEDGVYIPTGFIMDKIVDYVQENYPSPASNSTKVNINGIEKKASGYDVDLVISDVDLIFNSNGDFVRLDQ